MGGIDTGRGIPIEAQKFNAAAGRKYVIPENKRIAADEETGLEELTDVVPLGENDLAEKGTPLAAGRTYEIPGARPGEEGLEELEPIDEEKNPAFNSAELAKPFTEQPIPLKNVVEKTLEIETRTAGLDLENAALLKDSTARQASIKLWLQETLEQDQYRDIEKRIGSGNLPRGLIVTELARNLDRVVKTQIERVLQKKSTDWEGKVQLGNALQKQVDVLQAEFKPVRKSI